MLKRKLHLLKRSWSLPLELLELANDQREPSVFPQFHLELFARFEESFVQLGQNSVIEGREEMMKSVLSEGDQSPELAALHIATVNYGIHLKNSKVSGFTKE